MLIREGSMLFEISRKDFIKWLKNKLNGNLYQIEDAKGSRFIGHIVMNTLDLTINEIKKMVKDYESK